MQNQYNRKIKCFDYKVGEKVCVKKKTHKPGENRKLSPRKIGPWIVLRKCSNGVNFEIENEKDRRRTIIYHNRLQPYFRSRSPEKVMTERFDSPSNTDSSSSDEDETTLVPEPPYPTRNRRQPNPDGMGWDVVDNALDTEP